MNLNPNPTPVEVLVLRVRAACIVEADARAQRDDAIRELRAQGMSPAKIAEAVGTDPATGQPMVNPRAIYRLEEQS